MIIMENICKIRIRGMKRKVKVLSATDIIQEGDYYCIPSDFGFLFGYDKNQTYDDTLKEFDPTKRYVWWMTAAAGDTAGEHPFRVYVRFI